MGTGDPTDAVLVSAIEALVRARICEWHPAPPSPLPADELELHLNASGRESAIERNGRLDARARLARRRARPRDRRARPDRPSTLMRLLDLYCGGGVAADGYAQVGFDVTGADLFPMPEYPYPLIPVSALDLLGDPRWTQYVEAFDVLHASPPCQLFTRAAKLRDAQGGTSRFDDLLTPTIALLRERWSHKVWIVENVEDAKPLMPDPVRCCGSSFELDVQRHRLFSANVPLVGTVCNHSRFPLDPITAKPRPWGVYHVPGDSIPKGGRTALNAAHAAALMGVDRPMSWDRLKEGFPPAYTRHIGVQLLSALDR